MLGRMWWLRRSRPDAHRSTHTKRPRFRYVQSVALAGVPLVCLSQQAPSIPAPGLPEVQVRATHLIVQTKIDRTVYTLDATAKALNNSLSDLLNNIPSVDVDSEGVLSLRGSTDVTILVNGKPAPQLSGAAGAQNLLTMSSGGIQSIEVLTVPPAQYAAQGAAGIINIVTKEELKAPLAGSVQASVGDDDRAFASANVAYHSGPLSLTLNAQDRHDVRERVLRSDLVVPDTEAAGAIVNSTSSTQEAILLSTPAAGLDAKYALSDVDSLELSFDASQHLRHRFFTEESSGTDSAGAVAGDSAAIGTRHERQTELDSSFEWSHKFQRPTEELTVSLTRSTATPEGSYGNTILNLVPAAPTQMNQVVFQQSFSETEGDIDYSLPLARGQLLKIGYYSEKGTFRDSNNGSDSAASGDTLTPDPLLTNQFAYDQAVNAGYVSYEIKNSTETWDGLFGLREENAWTQSDDITDSSVTAATRNTLFPNLHLMHLVSNAITLSLAASRRITRPDADSLNPYVFREYSPNLSAGNPLLRPAITSSYEFGCNLSEQNASYALTAYHRYTTDARTIAVSTLGDGLTLTMPVNFDHIEASGLEFSADGTLSPKLSYSASGNLFYNQVPPESLASTGTRTTTGLNGKLKLTYRPVAADSLQLSYVRRDKSLTSQGYVAATNIVNAGLQHQFHHDWAMVATLSDILNDQYYQRSLSTPSFTQQYSRYTRGQVLYVGAIYTFGSPAKSPNLEYEKPDIETPVH
jgi:outer membrane receptor protein involved in Fe transport